MSLTVSQIRRRTFCALVRRATAFLLLALGAVTPAVAQSLPGDWIGLLNGGFKVRIHFEKAGSGFEGKLINPSGNETALDVVTSDGTHLHFAVNRLNLSYDAIWSKAESAWKGHLQLQGVYSLTLKHATPEEMGLTVHKRPQEDAIGAEAARASRGKNHQHIADGDDGQHEQDDADHVGATPHH